MLEDFYIAMLSNDMKIAVQKNYLESKIWENFQGYVMEKNLTR